MLNWLNKFSKVSVFQTLVQGNISNEIHNARLVIDPWTGKIYLIPHDVAFNSEDKELNEIIIDGSNNSIFKILNRSSDFLDLKYSLLLLDVEEDHEWSFPSNGS